MKNLYKSLILTPFAIFGLMKLADAQITTEQARPIDSALVAENLQSGNFHTINSHAIVGEDNIYTWDAGNGLYTPIPGYNVAWSHKGKVSQDTATLINNQPGQSYRLFDLDQMANTEAYRDSVETWMNQIGISVDVKEHDNIETKLFPNPIKNNAHMQANVPVGEKYKLLVTGLDGKIIEEYDGVTNNNGLNVNMNLNDLNSGIYVFTLYTNNNAFSTKGVKQ